MKPTTFAPQLLLQTRSGSLVLDIVVAFTGRPSTRAALTAAGHLSAELLPLIRIVRTPVVPFPRQVENAPISAGVLNRHLIPLAEEFGAHMPLCFTRDTREGLLHTLLTQMKAAKQRKHNARCSTTWRGAGVGPVARFVP